MKKLLCILMAICVLFCAACTKNTDVKPPEKEIEAPVKESETVTLYFSDANAISLVGETREIEENEKSLAENVMIEIFKGPENEDLIDLIPPGTALNSVTVEDKLCTVDLNKVFMEGAFGTLTDTLSVYSIVNSLTALDDVDKVQFLIDGEKVDLFGNFIFSEPFEADETLNK